MHQNAGDIKIFEYSRQKQSKTSVIMIRHLSSCVRLDSNFEFEDFPVDAVPGKVMDSGGSCMHGGEAHVAPGTVKPTNGLLQLWLFPKEGFLR